MLYISLPWQPLRPWIPMVQSGSLSDGMEQSPPPPNHRSALNLFQQHTNIYCIKPLRLFQGYLITKADRDQ